MVFKGYCQHQYETNRRRNKKKWFNPVRYAVYSFLLLSYLYIASDGYGNSSKKQIENESKMIGVKFNDGEVKKEYLLEKRLNIFS